MKTYGEFCPIAVASEVLAERWTPLIVRELFAGSHRFAELERGLPRVSKSILVQRLRALEAADVIERRIVAGRRGGEYRLTQAGQELAEIVVLLGDWGKRWGEVEIGPHNANPDYLLWDIHRRIRVELLPVRRIVVRFDLTGFRARSYWLLLERPKPSLCLTDPGFDVDLTVEADTLALHRVWMGQMDLAAALRDGSIVLDGPAPLRRAFPGWLALGFYAARGGRPTAPRPTP